MAQVFRSHCVGLELVKGCIDVMYAVSLLLEDDENLSLFFLTSSVQLCAR